MRRHGLLWSITAAVVLLAAAFGMLRALRSAHPPAPAPEESLARALARLEKDPGAWENETQQAVRLAGALLEDAPLKTAGAHYVRAVQYERESNFSGAEALLQQAIAADPQWAAPYAALGSLQGRQSVGRANEARNTLKKAIELAPDWSRPHNLLAIVLRTEGRLEEAEKEALEAIRLNPEDTAAHNNYANLLVQQNRYEEAEKQYRIAAAANPKHAKPYYNLACLHALTGKKKEAIDLLGTALERAPGLRQQASTDADLDALRDMPEFQKLVFGEVLSE